MSLSFLENELKTKKDVEHDEDELKTQEKCSSGLLVWSKARLYHLQVAFMEDRLQAVDLTMAASKAQIRWWN